MIVKPLQLDIWILISSSCMCWFGQETPTQLWEHGDSSYFLFHCHLMLLSFIRYHRRSELYYDKSLGLFQGVHWREIRQRPPQFVQEGVWTHWDEVRDHKLRLEQSFTFRETFKAEIQWWPDLSWNEKKDVCWPDYCHWLSVISCFTLRTTVLLIKDPKII